MKSANRYSLVHVSEDGLVTPLTIYFDVNGKEIKRNKFPLSQLDAFTTGIDNSDLLYDVFKMFSGILVEDGNFYIQYRQDMQDKRIRVAFSDDEVLKKFSKKNMACTYVKKDRDFETYVINFLYELRNDPAFFNYLYNSEEGYLNNYLIKQINRYFLSVDNGIQENVDFYFKKICEAFSSYKVIRNIEDGRKKYKEKKEIRNNEDSFSDKVLTYGNYVNGQGTLF